jgi:hypothetical protein
MGPIALTGSAWINAWTLARACAREGLELCAPPGTPGFPLPAPPAGQPVAWRLFTEEAGLRRALAGEGEGRFLPERFPAMLLDDKWAFAEFLAAADVGPRALPQWPLTTADNGSHGPFPLLLKARHSWRGATRLPRGWVCRSAAELRARLAALDAAGWRREDFFLQVWWGDRRHRVLSVCGFFDAESESRNLALLTDRVATYGDGPNSSAMLVTVPDTFGLVPAAEAILRRLSYRGPYELEFIESAGELAVIELNPRFWMQHGLFLALGNGLVRRYLGRESARERAAARGDPHLAWIDGTWLLRGLMRADRAVFGAWWQWCLRRRYRAVVCPGIGYLVALQLRRRLGRRR